jgi:hypothetical protein
MPIKRGKGVGPAGDSRMASKVKAAVKDKKDEAVPEKDAPDTPDAPLPLLDLSDAAVRKMIKAAKKRGYVTHDQVNAVLPSEEVTSDQIEDVFAMLNEMGINVVESEEETENLAAKVEQVVLDLEQLRCHRCGQVGGQQHADCTVEFVDRAAGLDAPAFLGHAAAVGQSRAAVVAGARHDLREAVAHGVKLPHVIVHGESRHADRSTARMSLTSRALARQTIGVQVLVRRLRQRVKRETGAALVAIPVLPPQR